MNESTAAPSGWRLFLFGFLFMGAIICGAISAVFPDGIVRFTAQNEMTACWVGMFLAACYLKNPKVQK